MSYLADLVKALNEDELRQFRLLDVIGKEEMVRDAYAKFARTKQFHEEQLPEKLGLTQSHFDKINSVLLAKTIQKLWSDDYLKVFFNITNKGLAELVFHQIKIQEKKLLKAGDANQITAFYNSTFDALRAMYHPHYNSKLTHEFGQKYLKSLGNKKRFEDEAQAEMLALYGDIIESRAKGNEHLFLPKAEAQLNHWRKKVVAKKNPVADCFFGIAEATYYKCFEDPKPFIDAYDFALRGFYAAKGKVEKRWEGMLLSERAFCYLSLNQSAKALEMYDKVMTEFLDTVGAHIYHQYTYFTSAVLSGNYEKAHRIFDEKFLVRARPDNPHIQMHFEVYALGFLLTLHEKDMAAATDWFKRLIAVPAKDLNPISKMMTRLYETTYFYFSGDMKTALRVSEKHLNYIKRLPDGTELYSLMYRPIDCINKFIKIAGGNTRLLKKTDEAAGRLYDGLNSLYHAPITEEWQRIKNNLPENP